MGLRRVPVDQSRVEGWLTGVRALGLVFAVPAVATTPYWPNTGVQIFVWCVTVVFALGTLVLWQLNKRVRSPHQRARFSLVATIFDSAIVVGYVVGFAFEQPYVTWSLVLALPVAGALRYRARGSLVLAAVAIAVFVVQSFVRVIYVDQPMLSAQIYAAGLIALIAGAMAALVASLDRQNEAYREQALELAESHRIRERLLAVTSHEFRGALAAIGTSAATVRTHRRRLSDERADRLLESVEGQVEQLLRLVDDLLISAQSSDGLAIRPAWREVRLLVEVALDAAARHRDGHAVEIYVEPIEAEIDHERVSQVVRNLVENAYKYAPGGTPVIVNAERTVQGLQITVSDVGPGIPSELRQQLFEPFQRGADEEVAGSGLGLYVVHRTVVAAGGSVDVRSSSTGTSFIVRLPCGTRPARTVLRSSDAARPLDVREAKDA